MSSKHTTIEQLQMLAQRSKAEIDKVDLKVTNLATKVNELVTVGGEPNVFEGLKVNDTLLALTEKVANLLITEGTANGTIAVNNVDVAVKGLAALAYKSEVGESDLAAALKAIIDAKAKQADLDTLTGTGEGSIAKMIDDAFNDFSTKVTDDNVVNSYKELIDYVAAHGSEAADMAAEIAANKSAIDNLKTFVGALPDDATATTVVGYIAEAIAALSIGDYAKTTEVETKITDALKDYYTKAEIDAMAATDAEVKTMLDEVFGAESAGN